MEAFEVELPQRQFSVLAAIAHARQSTVAEQVQCAVAAYLAQVASPASTMRAPAARRHTDRRELGVRAPLEWP